MEAVPAELVPIFGSFRDLDSHLMIPPEHLAEAAGPLGRLAQGVINHNPKLQMDGEVDADASTIWQVKGMVAPGAFDLDRRLESLDQMGIARQLVFPPVLIALALWGLPGKGARLAQRYNRFVAQWAAPAADRFRPVALLPTGDLGAVVAEIDRAHALGLRAFWFPHGRPTADLSPAADELDAVWARLAEAGSAALLHIGGEGKFTSDTWADTDTLRRASADVRAGEPIGPWLVATMGLAPQNYLATLIYGGVLERHPTLRVGVIETGAQWLGPLAEVLDQRVGLSRRTRSLPVRPSEYLRRQVRVTPFPWEPVGAYIERWGLAEVLAFSTDFPHPEGGTQPVTEILESLRMVDAASPSLVQDIFVRNGALLVG
jgi:predicted TIM-barrel fold metal-dependent hydrolase